MCVFLQAIPEIGVGIVMNTMLVGEQVYFVQDNWYNHEYVPRYRELHHDNEYGHSCRHNYNDENGRHQTDEHSNDDHHDEGDDY